jgi:hypothetical protein
MRFARPVYFCKQRKLSEEAVLPNFSPDSTETHLASETLCSVWSTGRWPKSRNAVILKIDKRVSNDNIKVVYTSTALHVSLLTFTTDEFYLYKWIPP